MIYYLCTRIHRYTFEGFLDIWGRSDRDRFRIAHYETLPFVRRFPAGTYIFADLERLSAPELAMASYIADALLDSGRARVLNHPSRFAPRLEMMRRFRFHGMSRFSGVRADQPLGELRYPVFVRHEVDHTGGLSDLLHTPQQLEATLATLERAGTPRRSMLVIEFFDTADASGTYRKYSVFRIGENFIAWHLLFSSKWMLKYADRVSDADAAEENAFIETNPHAAALRPYFDLANIDFGRADYAVAPDGKIEMWEINTNPNYGGNLLTVAPSRLPVRVKVAGQMVQAFQAIDTIPRGSPPIRVRVPRSMARQMGVNARPAILGTVGRWLTNARAIPGVKSLDWMDGQFRWTRD
jgi:hypothetical protein